MPQNKERRVDYTSLRSNEGGENLSFLSDLHQLRETGAVLHGDVGQHLAVDGDIGLLQTGNEAAVRQPVLAAGRIDAGDPQLAELPGARTAIPIRIIQRVQTSFAGFLPQAMARSALTLGKLQNSVVAPA